jgi:hypothetical protein
MNPSGGLRPKPYVLRKILRPRVKPDLDPKRKLGPVARRIRRIRRKLASLPPRLWLFSGALILGVAIAWLVFAPARNEVRQAGLSAGTRGVGGVPAAGITEKQIAFIKDVRLKPDQPTREDSLKTEVIAAPDAPEGLVYAYLWKVNDGIIDEAKGDTLTLTSFKKRDRITVTVTPSDRGTYGFAAVSPEVVIHSLPPSLELAIRQPANKAGDPIDLQLVSVAPDSGQVSFSLEPPSVPGMTVDKLSGKISWLPQPDQKGAIRFRAAVEDDQGTKVSKTFEINVK